MDSWKEIETLSPGLILKEKYILSVNDPTWLYHGGDRRLEWCRHFQDNHAITWWSTRHRCWYYNWTSRDHKSITFSIIFQLSMCIFVKETLLQSIRERNWTKFANLFLFKISPTCLWKDVLEILHLLLHGVLFLRFNWKIIFWPWLLWHARLFTLDHVTSRCTKTIRWWSKTYLLLRQLFSRM